MGGAILAGLIKNRIINPSQVTVYDKILAKARTFQRRWRVMLSRNNAEVVRRSEIVVLAVKPQDLFETAREFQGVFTPRHLLISILAGTPVARVRKAVGPKPQIVRAMPNLGAQVGEAITALSASGRQSFRSAQLVFSGCGKTVRLPERYFDIVTAISGSGPAYFFLLMELLAKEAQTQGLPERVARELAVQTAVGAGLLAKKSALGPEELRRMVTSRGGTTEAALQVFEKNGLARIVSKGIRAALRRGRELSRQ